MLTDGTKKRLEFLITLLYYATIVGLLYLVYRLVGIVIPFVIAFMLAAILEPLKRWIQRKLKLNGKWLSFILTAIIYLSVAALLFLAAMKIVLLLRELLSALPNYFNNTIAPLLTGESGSIESWITQRFPGSQTVITAIQGSMTNVINSLVNTVSQAGASAVGGLWSGLPGFVMGLLFTILLSFPISAEYNSVKKFLLNQLPEKIAARISEVKEVAKKTVLKYLKSQLILMAITFVLTISGLLIAGIQNAVGMAIVIAFIDLLPVFGAGTIMIPWVIIELIQGNINYAIGIAIVYIIVTVVRNVLSPKIVGDQLGLNPIISLLSIYVGFRLLGIVGMIFFPIIIQIFVAMQNKGSLRLYKEKPDGAAVTGAHSKDEKP
ncbi:MAG: sporulation integral membrane protein YtvI [Oscillospiraceae bacterium]|nr:sporulation integral membrane protein YtvI [Oscillospiraceae bacterium]